MRFNDNLKRIRGEKRLSQQKLADMLKIAQSTVGMWESGRRTPKLEEIERLAKVLRVTVNRLVGKSDRKIQIIRNEVYIDGRKVEEFDAGDVREILLQIEAMRGKKSKSSGGGEKKRTVSPPRKILIIDDDQEMCEMLYSFLVPHNYRVFLTFNGQMGLEYLDEVKPDIILLDLTMPDMDGIDVLKIIRKVSVVPVVVITAYPQDIADIHLKDLKIEGYIEKPFSLEQVLNTIKHIIGE
jgi:CheY-like chemotaxis protein/DNA-binding XRE family transcriptional regulator